MAVAWADDAFEKQIAPLLIRRCVGCHNPSEPNGGLDLTTARSAFEGGDSGEAIVASQPDESYLLERVVEGSMPPEDQASPLEQHERDALRSWIAAGAPWPAERRLSSFEFSTERRAGYDWWSLQPPVRPVVPTVDESIEIYTEIDAFIVDRLASAGLKLSPPADRATLLRRVKFDLVGLPPSPEEIDAFVVDMPTDPYERLVDRLLESPHYGERWGRHWLDVVRFGETNGYETNTPRPNAWPYRDYVIAAFNEDKPFHEFVREQLAGDLLGVDVATGFLVGGTHDTVGNQTIEGQRQQRVDDLDDMIATTTGTFLGLTAGCAKCHDHKFDPISQRDYYALQAIFAGVEHGEREIRGLDYEQRLQEEPHVRRELARVEAQLYALEPLAAVDDSISSPHRPSVSARRNVDRFAPVVARWIRFTALATNQFEPCLDELEILTADEEPLNVALASQGALATASSVFANGTVAIHQLHHVNDGLYGNSHSWISAEPGTGWVQIELPRPMLIDRVLWGRDREERFDDRLAIEYRIEVATELDAWQVVATQADRLPFDPGSEGREFVSPDDVSPDEADTVRKLLAQREKLLARLPESGRQHIYAGKFIEPAMTHLLYRGDPMQPREQVAPGAISAVGRPLELSFDAAESARRRALADWIVDETNPLTARVWVNRLWHYHFGRGLVDTPSDFGFHGGRPTHPELLDWLATELIARGWSTKQLQRLILRSAVYRQSGLPRASALAVDAESRWLWRFVPRRLEAEPIRDSMLAISGRLDLHMGGPGYDTFEENKNYVHVYEPRQQFGPAEWRRMVYQFKPRIEQDATFGAFDCPDASSGVARRNVSTTALQALNLLNSPFVVQQADFFAERLVREAGEEPADQAIRGFQLTFGRSADQEELAAAVELIEQHGLSAFCRALFNANEFVFVN